MDNRVLNDPCNFDDWACYWGAEYDGLSVHAAYPCDFPLVINWARNKDTRDFDASSLF
ncbi:hypothetical protein OROHE_001651 [Orobanche hederae]